jgi:hypothetical protein
MDDRLGWCSTPKVLLSKFTLLFHSVHSFIYSAYYQSPYQLSVTISNANRASFVHDDHILFADQLFNRNDSPAANKKAKKNAIKLAAQQSSDANDTAALNRRAERFQREHELERTKNLRNGGIQALKVNQHTSHLFRDMSLSRGGSPFGHSDDPEADPVRFLCAFSLPGLPVI